MESSALSYASILFVVAFAYGIYSTWVNISHRLAARRLGCKPAFARRGWLPLGLDTLMRSIIATRDQVLQNDDVAVYEEIGCHATWVQNILGSWYHTTVDPENVKAMLATQFKDFELGPLRMNLFGPLLGHGIFTSDGQEWYVNLNHFKRVVLLRGFTGNTSGHFCGHNSLAARSRTWLSKKRMSSTY